MKITSFQVADPSGTHDSNTAGSTTVVFGVTIPAVTTYRTRCNAAGVWEHVSFS
jgi:hypothetical protein